MPIPNFGNGAWRLSFRTWARNFSCTSATYSLGSGSEQMNSYANLDVNTVGFQK
jgi:hypothetical protein